MQKNNVFDLILINIHKLAAEIEVLRKPPLSQRVSRHVGPTAYVDDTSIVYNQAVKVIQNLGKNAIPILTSTLLDSKDSSVRMSAAILLSELKSEAAVALPELVKALEDEDWEVCCWILIAISNIGSAAIEAIPYVANFIHDQNGIVTQIASWTLIRIGPSVIPVVVKALDNTNHFIRHEAARILGELGSEASLAVPVLISKIESENTGAKISMIEALGKIGDRQALPILEELKRENLFYNSLATLAIEKIMAMNKETN